MNWLVTKTDTHGPVIFALPEASKTVRVLSDGSLDVRFRGTQTLTPQSVVERLYRAFAVREAHRVLTECRHEQAKPLERLMAEVCYDCYGIRRRPSLKEDYGPWELETQGIMRTRGWLRKEPWPPADLVPGWCDPDSPYFDEELTLRADDEARAFEKVMEESDYEVAPIEDVLKSVENNEMLAQWVEKIEAEGAATPKKVPPVNGKCRCPDCGTVWTAAVGATSVNCLRCQKSFEPKVMVVRGETPRDSYEPFPDVLRGWVPQTYGDALAERWIEVGDCEPHEWDNRTSAENAKWMIEKLRAKLSETSASPHQFDVSVSSLSEKEEGLPVRKLSKATEDAVGAEQEETRNDLGKEVDEPKH